MSLKYYYIENMFSNWEKISIEGIYFSGIEGEGEFKEWYDNGQLRELSFYKIGLLDDEYKAWHNNGQLHLHCFFKNDELEGEYKIWHGNGLLEAHQFYINDRIIWENEKLDLGEKPPKNLKGPRIGV